MDILRVIYGVLYSGPTWSDVVVNTILVLIVLELIDERGLP